MFKVKLKRLREQAGLSQALFAARLGIAQSTVGNWESGSREPNFDMVKKIADYFKVSIDYLLEENYMSGENTQYVKEEEGYFNNNLMTVERRKIPLIGEISCGEPILAMEDFECYVDAANDVKADFALRAKGDSMIDARIYDGDIVFIRKQPMVENGRIAAVIIDDEVTLKRVYVSENAVTLLAANKAYPPMVYVNTRASSIRILGLAVAFQSIVR